jgi:D-serine deaminase-like pyridoxal phosphate-dependent protein
MFDDIQKPTLLLDLQKMEANIRRMTEKTSRMGIRFRPHFKTHQSRVIGESFRELGVKRITVSSVDMARYFASAGWRNITIAFPVNLRQLDEIEALAREIKLGLLVESEASAAYLAKHMKAPARIWIEIDTGGRRSGVAWEDYESLYHIVEALKPASNLRLRGLLTHAGHTYAAPSPDEICRTFQRSVATINQSRAALTLRYDMEVDVSVGDTPGCTLCEVFGPVDEVRPGNFIFYDAEEYSWGVCRAEDIAVALACPVVAVHPERNEAVLYGGAIHLSKDFFEQDGLRKYGLVSLPEGKGWSEPLPDTYISSLSQEHGVMKSTPDVLAKLNPGDLVMVLPAHSCLTVQAMGAYLTLDGREIPILA